MQNIGLITTFNHEKYIDESVKSMLKQSIKLDHLLIIDDASVDRTATILNSFKNQANISIITNETNLGPSASLNKALKNIFLTFGDCLVFLLSGDDFSHRHRVRIQTRLLKNLPKVVAVTGNFRSSKKIKNSNENFTPKKSGYLSPQSLFYDGNFVCAPATTIRLSSFLKKYQFNQNLLFLQDFELWIKMAWDKEIYYDIRKVIDYNVHDDSLSNQKRIKSTNSEILYLKEEAQVYRSFFDGVNRRKILSEFNFAKNLNEYYLRKFKVDCFMHEIELISFLRFFHSNQLVQSININKDLESNNFNMDKVGQLFADICRI
jgi:glycosyltransferase involved in cell wall biosynthesis